MDKFVDMHTHTTASDGMNTPAQNVRMAFDAGLSGIAITDHDTVSGLEEALAEGKRLGIEVVPGVEISTVHRDQGIHLLGYFVDFRSEAFLRRLERLRQLRTKRNEMIVEKLRELGIPASLEEIRKHAKKEGMEEKTLGRPHIAQWMAEKGYVSSVGEAFDRYLAKGGLAFVQPPRVQTFEAIEWIREAGGCAVIAHPGLRKNDELIREIIAYGVDGIEAFHSEHTPEEEMKYKQWAEAYRLVATAGSDFHGERGGRAYHAPLGARKMGMEVLERLKEKRRIRR